MNQATLANVARSWKSAATVALEGVGILGNMAEDALALLFPDAAGNAGESERRARLTRVSTMVAEVERRIADAEQALGVATAAFEKKKAVYQRSADNAAKMAADSSVKVYNNAPPAIANLGAVAIAMPAAATGQALTAAKVILTAEQDGLGAVGVKVFGDPV
jgi:hypothetical protein